MFESFCDRDLKDTGSCDELGAGAPVVQSKGDHSGEFDRRCKTKHTQREGLHPLRIRCGGVGHNVHVTLLAMIALSDVQSPTQTFICNAILFIDTSNIT